MTSPLRKQRGTPASVGWLIGVYEPVSLFALKPSYATSAAGITLVAPTPYAVKMALVDSAFRAGWPDADCGDLLKDLAPVAVRLAPPEAVVTHTQCKIRQEPKTPTGELPYISSVAYREYAHQRSPLRIAFELAPGSDLRRLVELLLPYVRYLGKRGSFIQYVAREEADCLTDEYTVEIQRGVDMVVPLRCHTAPLDDFGPDADLETLSTFSEIPAKAGRHRIWRETIIPLGRVRSGHGFTEYRR